jgi:L-amino acid N-acyltransferase YncA
VGTPMRPITARARRTNGRSMLSVYVHPTAQRSGMGKALYTRLFTLLR